MLNSPLFSAVEEEAGFLGDGEPSQPSELVPQRRIKQGTGAIEFCIMSHLKDHPTLLL